MTTVRFKGKESWKPIAVDPNLYLTEGFDNLISFEELTDYEIIEDNVIGKSKKKGSKKTKDERKRKPQSEVSDIVIPCEEESVSPRKRKKKDNTQILLGEQSSLESELKTTAKEKKLGKQKKKGKTQIDPLEKSTAVSEVITPKGNKSKKRKKKEKLDTDDDSSCQPKKKQKKGGVVKNKPVSELQPNEKKPSRLSDKDMSAWKDLYVPSVVLHALADQGFTAPTPVQALSLPAAIRDRRDVLGAAETGSGKTLAFGIPILDHILKHREYLSSRQYKQSNRPKTLNQKHNIIDDDDEAYGTEELEEEEDEETSDMSDIADEDGKSEDVSEEGESDEGETEYDTADDTFTESLHAEGIDDPEEESGSQLLALILEPTRELAIQVKNHLQAAAKHTDIKIVSVVGGMSEQKQQRLLKKKPEVVVATPGRLWELIQIGDPHLSTVKNVHQLVIDEADRMIEKGHFEELSKLLDHLNVDEGKKRKRQTFVFSATLTLVHSGPQRFMKKKKKIVMTPKQKLETLMYTVGVKEKPMVIDLTRKAATAQTLTEAKILCKTDEKDLYLYYFRVMHPGRTVVFANSKDCIRRLVSIFTLLQCCPLPLHADMHQRQRLKNLDRFKGNPNGFLLATDVAARGLDIPDVQHVIHYQVPRTTENYVHRSGRTARALKEGLSVMLVGPDDVNYYRKIMNTLNKDEDLDTFPFEQETLPAIKARVQLARDIDRDEYRSGRSKKQNNWFIKAAQEMDIELDEDNLLNDIGDSNEQAQLKLKLKHMKASLSKLLNQPLVSKSFSGRYPTKSGKLILPYKKDSNALTEMNKIDLKKAANTVPSRENKKMKKKRRHKFNKKKSG